MNLDGDLGEKFQSQQGCHGEYKWHVKQLSEICLLDNHYAEPGNPGVVISSRMIMENYGGPRTIAGDLYTDFTKGIDGTEADK